MYIDFIYILGFLYILYSLSPVVSDWLSAYTTLAPLLLYLRHDMWPSWPHCDLHHRIPSDIWVFIELLNTTSQPHLLLLLLLLLLLILYSCVIICNLETSSFTFISPCIHSVFTLYSSFLHPVFTLPSPCIHASFTLYSSFLHPVFTFPSLYSLFLHLVQPPPPPPTLTPPSRLLSSLCSFYTQFVPNVKSGVTLCIIIYRSFLYAIFHSPIMWFLAQTKGNMIREVQFRREPKFFFFFFFFFFFLS